MSASRARSSALSPVANLLDDAVSCGKAARATKRRRRRRGLAIAQSIVQPQGGEMTLANAPPARRVKLPEPLPGRRGNAL